MDKDTAKLIDDVEALCRVYVGKNAESEEWSETCVRLANLDKLIKKIRRAQKRVAA
jgi:hypothetical protein